MQNANIRVTSPDGGERAENPRNSTITSPPARARASEVPEPRQKPPHPELGLLHQTGPKAIRFLREAGIEVPDRWVVLADHPRRGLVIAVPPDGAHAEVLDWLLHAATALTRVPLTGAWQAAVYGRRA